ncbi:MAG: M15 family metallopeptidase [Eubacteriaceae bacterium]|jgi:D-alanyl-D-alanine carboxypeptidase
MKIRVKNYKRFILTSTVIAAVCALIIWGAFALVFKVFKPAAQVRKVDIIQPQQTEVVEAEPHTENDLLMLVNKDNAIPDGYSPQDLVTVPLDSLRECKLCKEASDALESLFAGASAQGYSLVCVSGYRDYASQVDVHNDEISAYGEEQADMTSAPAGYSEHETGLAMDISSASNDYDLTEAFGTTDEGKWVAAHAAEYGFIIRYPDGKESITGYTYEPWHLRYVGKDAAKEITDQNTTLEEYLNSKSSS